MVGIGYRKDFAEEFTNNTAIAPAFVEVAPENWINVGGYYKKMFDKVIEQYPLYTHGLSLSLGSPEPLDFGFLKQIKTFLQHTGAVLYSEHLSFSKCDNAHLFDLLPIPFTEDAVKHVAQKIRQAQEVLETKIAVEIVSYYTPVAPEMSEVDFINSVVSESGCDLLLDINNIYVNSFNHKYNPETFLQQLDLSTVRYIHMAGHTQVSPSLIIDTHGEAIATPVYHLFEYAVNLLGRDVPVLLERDFNIPDLEILQQELQHLEQVKAKSLQKRVIC